ncbi:aldehyde dehydrogenase family protein [Phormidium sp. FACHB-1136]|uniref:aldehyde dehydrogenase family protein n=1 Tax=Phormidium sp. FACHB-1136 TaxID=2692848 RepID=UPI001683CA95|nr:aldehyde dehydrogenase family protein [Phormidium sp. FACHB-1136]MBD2424833.1 aldehyde dehydrogenase family protein [Phormidium sp. FACHB-1136]
MVTLGSQEELSAVVGDVAQAGYGLRLAGVETQSRLLEAMADQLEAAQNEILEANTLDLEASLEMAVPDLVLDWLKLTPERLHIASKILRRLAFLGDPRWLNALPINRWAKAATGYSQVVPLGVVALVYEAFPELAAIMAGFCVRTGNGLILKGGNEASQTNQAIMEALHRALTRQDLPEATVVSLADDSGDAARSWLLQDPGVNLVIPYGRPSLVKQVMRQAAVPVLPTAMGNCYLYWAASGTSSTVTQIVLDSHRGEPDAVNALEKVLIHAGCSTAAVVQLCRALWDHGFTVLGDEAMQVDIPDLSLATPKDWQQPFLAKRVALSRVEGLAAAATWINRHSSGHANVLVSDTYSETVQFPRLVNSAVVYINTSPRFVRNPSQAAAMALGMTTQQGRCQGFVGLNALLTTQHVLQGLD